MMAWKTSMCRRFWLARVLMYCRTQTKQSYGLAQGLMDGMTFAAKSRPK